MSETKKTSLAPMLLVSMPQLVDPNFKRTVILLCKHSDEGAFGVVVNRPITAAGRVVVSLDTDRLTEKELQVWSGGPVEPEHSWMLLGHDMKGATDAARMDIADGLSLSTSPELLRRLLEPNPPPRTRLIVGYAGWAPGQLESELEESAWLLSDVDQELLFNTPAEQMWEKAIRRMGADPAALHGSRGVH
ncbi:MAG: YqgE/AlgH family protein [Acidobacteriaceae bacterium]|jgi:putative transcriptional regulator|nr:YqgE/AlgH family protein [Acidobacteriaceae bacterium]